VGDSPDFRFETSARALAAVPLVLFAVVAALAVAATAVFPVLRQEEWWVKTLAVGVPAGLLFLGVWFGPAAVRGGVYRAEVRGGRVRVDSPSRRVFGPSIDVDLAEIERLVIRVHYDPPNEYELWTAAGAYRVDSICGADLFDAIRRVRPDVPCA